MPTELIIALIAFVAFPIGLFLVAWISHLIAGDQDDQYLNPKDWGSQDIDRRNS